MSEREQATVAAWVIEDFTVERVIFGAGVTRISTEMGGDDQAAAVVASPVDQPGDTTLRKGVLGCGKAWRKRCRRSDQTPRAAISQALINRPHRSSINPDINPSISHLNQPFLSALLRNPAR